jgi:hypothetical protein
MIADPRPDLSTLTNRDSNARSYPRQTALKHPVREEMPSFERSLHLRLRAWTQPTTSNRCSARRDRSPPIGPGPFNAHSHDSGGSGLAQ